MWFLYGLTILAGVANAIQPGQNATLSKSLGQPVSAALVILLISTAALLVGGLALGKLELPSASSNCPRASTSPRCPGGGGSA